MFINMTIIYVLELSMKEIRKGGFGKEGGVWTFTDELFFTGNT